MPPATEIFPSVSPSRCITTVSYTHLRLYVPDTGAATKLIMEHPELFRDYEITKGKMDDVFLAVTGKVLEGGDEE